MSAKQSILEHVRLMSDQSTWDDIVKNLMIANPDRNVELSDDEEPDEDGWREIMAHAFAAELADPAEDIYQDMR